MLTLFLCSAAATVSLLSGPFEYLSWALYSAAILHAATAAFEARHTPSRAALGQLGRCIATLAAPTVSATSPFVHFTTLGALLFPEVPLSPAVFALSAQAALLCACLANGGLDAFQNARGQASTSRRNALHAKVMIEDGPDHFQMLSQMNDLALRLAILEDRLQHSTRKPVAETDAEPSESPFDAPAAALVEMGYHDGPWNAQTTVDTPSHATPDCDAALEDSYPPLSDDADFLKVMERP